MMEILDLPMLKNDVGAKTIREYLKLLLRELWVEKESFSGKRPFGNSGWEHDLYRPLVKAGIVKGTIDEDGYLEDYDREAADHAILNAIQTLQ